MRPYAAIIVLAARGGFRRRRGRRPLNLCDVIWDAVVALDGVPLATIVKDRDTAAMQGADAVTPDDRVICRIFLALPTIKAQLQNANIREDAGHFEGVPCAAPISRDHKEDWSDTTCPVALCSECREPWPCDSIRAAPSGGGE